jgi:CDP-diglyceride synthetase
MADESVAMTTNPLHVVTLQPRRSKISFSVAYMKTLPGILKIVEIVLSLLTFICSCVDVWEAARWAQFQSAFAVISTTGYLVLYLLNLVSRLPGPWPLIEFIYYMIFTGCFLITAIAAAAQAVSAYPSISATAYFAFAATSFFAVDTFFHFRAWRAGQIMLSTVPTAASATTSNTMTTGNPDVLLEHRPTPYS